MEKSNKFAFDFDLITKNPLTCSMLEKLILNFC